MLQAHISLFNALMLSIFFAQTSKLLLILLRFTRHGFPALVSPSFEMLLSVTATVALLQNVLIIYSIYIHTCIMYLNILQRDSQNQRDYYVMFIFIIACRHFHATC